MEGFEQRSPFLDAVLEILANQRGGEGTEPDAWKQQKWPEDPLFLSQETPHDGLNRHHSKAKEQQDTLAEQREGAGDRGPRAAHSAEPRNERAKPCAKVITIANHVQGRLDHSRATGMPIRPSNATPMAIPARIGEKMSKT